MGDWELSTLERGQRKTPKMFKHRDKTGQPQATTESISLEERVDSYLKEEEKLYK